MLCQLRVNLWEANATNGIINGSDAAQLAVHLEHFLLCDIHEYRVYKLQLLKAQNRLDEHELQSAKRNLNDTLSPMMKPQRSQQHNNPAMTTLKDSAGKFIFTSLQVYTQLIRRP